MAIPGGVGQGRKHASARNGGLAPALLCAMYTRYTTPQCGMYIRHVHTSCAWPGRTARTLHGYIASTPSVGSLAQGPPPAQAAGPDNSNNHGL